MNKIFFQRQKGFSLLEILVSMIVMTTLAMGVMSTIGLSGRANVGGAERMQATMIAENLFAETRNEYERSGLVPVNAASVLAQVQLEMPQVIAVSFSCTEETSSGAACTPAVRSGLKRLQINLSWRPRAGGLDQQVSMVSYVYRK